MSSADAEFLRVLTENKERVNLATPGLQVRAYSKGRLQLDVEWGKTYPYYDLASLTKIIFTASALGRAFDRGILRPSDLAQTHWPEFKNSKVTLEKLLTHTAGLPWWLPLFKKLRGERTPEKRWEQLGHLVSRIRKGGSRRAVYSDVDLFVLGQVLTHATELSLTELWDDLSNPTLTGNMHFNLGARKFAKSKYAPTEKCKWRGRVLQGEVHDENAWALGGIAPHAGLFGRMEDVSRWGLGLRACFRESSSALMKPATLKRFASRHTKPSIGDWGWLFMKPSPKISSTGKYFSQKTFGHLGFTGTSLWYDPKPDLLVIILSNRVHPTRENLAFPRMRADLHNWIVESLK